MVGRAMEGGRESERKRENAISNVPEKRIVVVVFILLYRIHMFSKLYRGGGGGRIVGDTILTFRRLV